MDGKDLIILRREGLYCPAGDFYIDPERGVQRAVITHAHGDHARRGCGRYWAAAPGLGLLRERLARSAQIDAVPYGQSVTLGRAQVSFHSAGHMLGSAQVRIECDGQVWVVSGDYKREPDPSCAPFEPVPCDVFVTETTFADPQFTWRPPSEVIDEIVEWWVASAARGHAAILYCYAAGKAQRILAELALREAALRAAGCPLPALVSGSMLGMIDAYRRAGITLLPTEPLGEQSRSGSFAGRLILAPPNTLGSRWMRRFGPHTTAFASGWMGEAQGARQQAYSRGFTLSDHADWPGLLKTIGETGARRVLTMHGPSQHLLIEPLRARGVECAPLVMAAPPKL